MKTTQAKLAILERFSSQDMQDLCDDVRLLSDLLAAVSRAEHDSCQVASRGVLHQGSWDRCEAIICEAVRAALTQEEPE